MILSCNNITKTFGTDTILSDCSFHIEEREKAAIVGPNGAGKSTLINIIANRIFADHGTILIDDIPAKENMQVHEKIFCMSEADLYDKDLKIKEDENSGVRWVNIEDVEKVVTEKWVAENVYRKLNEKLKNIKEA